MKPLSTSDYERFRGLIHERVGLHFGEDKRADLAKHLAVAVQESGSAGLDAYFIRLCAAAPGDDLWAALVSRLTVGETYFFRNTAQFAALREHILPSLIQRRRASGQLILRLWSAGCASGEEPYSLAIILRELLPDLENWSVMILATDVDRKALARAEKGVYKDFSFRIDTPTYVRSFYFKPNGHGLELKPEIRRMVQFAWHNLKEDNYPSPQTYTLGLDLIMCRNVTIYFQQDTTRQIVRRFHAALLEDGWLVVGHSEPQVGFYEGFEARNFEGTVIYQKSPGAETGSKLRVPLDSRVTAQQAIPAFEPHSPPPDDVLVHARQARRIKQAEQVNKAPEKASPDEAIPQEVCAASCCATARELADQMQWVEAQRWLERALKEDPLLVEAHFLHALIHQHQGNSQAALDALKRALYLDRSFVLGHFNVGMIHWTLGNTRQARQAWNTTRALLKNMPQDSLLPYGDGMSAGYLLSILSRQFETEEQDGC